MEIATENKKIKVNDVTLWVDDAGAGAIPIIFIHGFPFDKSSWEPQMTFFKKTHRVIAYNIRGFGVSPAGTEKKSIPLFADDLVGLMDGLGISKAVVCGLSMGGYILLNAVYRYPERFAGVILCDTQCIADSEEAKEKRKQTILEIIQAKGLEKFADGFVNNVFSKNTLEHKKRLVDKIKNTILATPQETITETLSALAERADMCASLDEIEVPALIICGREDKVIPLVQSEFLQKAIGSATLHIIEKAGHLSNLERPDEFNKALSDFLVRMPLPEMAF